MRKEKERERKCEREMLEAIAANGDLEIIPAPRAA
jgi:hypothetical protein